MAVDMFLKLEGINGESAVSDKQNWIDVLAWSWGMHNSGTAHMAQGAGAGKVSVQDLSITKYADKASPILVQHCCTGKHIPKGQLTVRKAGDKPLEYIVIELKDVFITNVSSGGSGGEDRLTENVTLNFAEFKVKYTPQKPDGSAGASTEFGFNIAQYEKK
jgi:type VI secretion system secreted protein Hcp